MSLRKVGGIWFARFWRIRFSFCIASNNPRTRRSRVSEYQMQRIRDFYPAR